MKLSAALVLGLVASVLAAATKEDHAQPAVRAHAQPVAHAQVYAPPAVQAPKTVYGTVDRFKGCWTPYSTHECPAGFVCTLTKTCAPLGQPGSWCHAGQQCLSGVCRHYYCVKDTCTVSGQRYDCPKSHACVASTHGNMCRPKDDTCEIPMSSVGCPAGQYCAQDSRCAVKQAVNTICSRPMQCLHGVCRSGKCKADACPTIDSSVDCLPTHHCTSGLEGNVCTAKRANGERCSTSAHCISGNCDRRRCVENECPVPYSTQHCPAQQYCSPGLVGNTCKAKLGKGEACSNAPECTSGICTGSRCIVNECVMPLTSDGCSTNQICVATLNGNACMLKLANNAQCTAAIQCMSNNCDGSSVCLPQGGSMPSTTTTTTTISTTTASTTTLTTTTTATTPTTIATTAAPLAINAPCLMDIQCLSLRCIGQVCVAPLLDNGETCSGTFGSSMQCRSNRCVSGGTSGGPIVSLCLLGRLEQGAVCDDDLQCASAQCIDGFCTGGAPHMHAGMR